MTADPIIAVGDLAELRADAQTRMASTTTIRRRASRGVQDEGTGLEATGWVTVATGQPFRLKAGRSRTVTIGGVTFEEATAEAHLPASVSDVTDGDMLEVTDGDWTGSVWRVVEAVKGDQAVVRRLPVLEVPRPADWP